ncbi:hypothetical protein GCM10027280_13360 [Micromonospora polyrhachis]|uniref:Uncharacterized protein n=1 Tax=Micromonospora polyrhachis TaxID=1282883 RepID=A0A7W7ST39_9ACTN|nr:hypothetical protein [Micromonospora polyrhachis]MBB4960071.1 hypothetical protein [Micromonospora polyrhachis]
MMNNSEMSRIRRQMRQRIRDVVAERRLARENDANLVEATNQTAQLAADSPIDEGSLIGG